jgi:hypothetical protein
MEGLIDDSPIAQVHLRELQEFVLAAQTPEATAIAFAEYAHFPPSITAGRTEAERAAMGKAIRELRIPPRSELKAQLEVIRDEHIPLLVVHGSWNESINLAAQRVAGLGGGRAQEIECPHHFPHLEGEAFNEMLDAFMRAAP